MFEACGPFTLYTHDKNGIDKVYKDIQADETDNLENGIGIYIIASGYEANFIPRYVGQTQDAFGKRLKAHFDKGKFENLADDGPLQIFLLARTTHQGKIVPKEEATGRDSLFIDQLEQKLVGHCVELNKDLLNVHYRDGEKKIYVAGFQDRGAKRTPAAKSLGALLGT
jgi:hypothetical protein